MVTTPAPAFIRACKYGDLEVVQTYAAAADFAPNTLDAKGFAGLHYAAWCGHEDIVTFLLDDERTDPAVLSLHGYSPLHLAARDGHAGVVQALCARTAGVNAWYPPQGMTALMHAAREGHAEAAAALLAVPGIRVNLPNVEGDTAWHLACLPNPGQAVDERVKIIKPLAASPGIDVNTRNLRGETGFMVAVKTNNYEMVAALINGNIHCDIDSNAVERVHGDNSFTAACRAGFSQMVLELLAPHSVEIDLNHTDQSGRNGLTLAVINGHHDLVSELLFAYDNNELNNMNLNQQDHEGETAFHHASRSDDFEMITVFIRHLGRVRADVRNHRGLMPLDVSASQVTRDRIAHGMLILQGQLDSKRHGPEFFHVDIEKKIGAGGNGEAFGGTFDGKPAAIKRPKGFPSDPMIRDAFQKEVSVWASLLNHDNILPLLGFCESPLMMASPWAPHGDMWRYLWGIRKDAGYYSKAMRILRGIAAGLDYAQRERYVCHGDLKPGNVLIFDGPDGWPLAKLADFGTSKIRPNDHSVISATFTLATTTRYGVGTLRFAAPEVVRQALSFQPGQHLNKAFKSDVWAFAMIVYVVAYPGNEPYANFGDDGYASVIA